MPSNILDLPEELLLMVFKAMKEDYEDIDECQYVCRAWYLPAHLMILKEVELDTIPQIQQFITSINHNPKSCYLNAVQKFQISLTEDAPLSKDEIMSLFGRFPNLKEVELTCSLLFLEEFDDDLCNALLEKCPKLDKFELDTDDTEDDAYYEGLLKLRVLVTEISLEKIKNADLNGGITQILTKFPRLQKVDGTIQIDNIQSFLPIIVQLPKLNRVKLSCAQEDQANFLEAFLTGQSTEEQQQTANRLSEITTISLSKDIGFCLNSIIFVTKYLTGLKDINISCLFNKNWTDAQQRLYLSLALDLLHPIEDFRMEMVTTLDTLSEYFQLMVHKAFLQAVSNNKKSSTRTFKLKLHDKYEDDIEIAESIILSRPRLEIVCVNLSDRLNFRRVSSKLFKQDIPFNDIERFELEITKRNQYSCKVNDGMYDNILKAMPSLKEVVLDVPESYAEDRGYTSDITYPKLEELTFIANPNMKFQSLLDRYSVSFPNLKKMKICYYSGHWKEYLGEFQVELGRYSLESLIFDVTPVKRMKKEQSTKRNFFVIEVSILCNSKRYLYKVPYDLSSTTAICYSDLDGLARGTDYLQVHITTTLLKSLELFAYTGSSDDYSYAAALWPIKSQTIALK